ncbi:right-handed parallel beta-helix repeat-containing protein [Frigidibacter sp. RF13]|uniref:right-handed parallel beta-helix repeat-containing protein n=1 Tax=Frigidibacter sp. RF13 TaxID=2997340 RepID=UPI00226F46AE|nr:right-handed parallel beta-helix repeat-containing protein [Frigidibacter sp. RF13]MCY1128074.1 right-handed parallel beta-helix repeat-containing protein [Frigidibacter sp. RF13]
MKLLGSMLIASLALGVSATALSAADYYIMPVRPGPVAGTPLAAISLKATKRVSRMKLNVNERGNTAGKWVSVGEPTTTTTTETTKSATSSSAEQPLGTTTETTTTGATSPTAISPTAISPTTTPAAGATYPTVAALLKSGQLQGGDRVFLMDGYHGPINISGYRFSSAVTFQPMPGQTAQVDSILIGNSANVTMRDIKVWATSANAGSGALVRTYTNSSDIAFYGLDVRSVPDAAKYLSWDVTAWRANKRSGFQLQGARNIVVGSRVTGIYHGIQVEGPQSQLVDNIVDGFAGDAMRALGDDSLVRRNKVQNCFQIDANHADGFQSFSRGPTGAPGAGTVYNLVIENNKILEWTASSTNSLRCKLQGIGMFDGMYDGTQIRNNVISVTGYHGITIAGALNTTIAQNTVINALGQGTNYPWIAVNRHKNGTMSRNVVIGNNASNLIKNTSKAANNIVVSNNVVVRNMASEFTAYRSQDYSLLPGALSANAGSKAYQTPSDIVGAPRPKGNAPDAGAYESQ